jgi:hypothetical protein
MFGLCKSESVWSVYICVYSQMCILFRRVTVETVILETVMHNIFKDTRNSGVWNWFALVKKKLNETPI